MYSCKDQDTHGIQTGFLVLVASGKHNDLGEKPIVRLYTCIDHHAGTPKERQEQTMDLDITQLLQYDIGLRSDSSVLKSGSSIGESERNVTCTDLVP